MYLALSKQYKADFAAHNTIYIMFSGGIDSTMLAHYMKSKHPSKNIVLWNMYYSEANRDWAPKALDSITRAAGKENISLVMAQGKLGTEAEMRDQRYNAFNQFMSTRKGIALSAHQIDDQFETWMFTSLHLNPKLIPYRTQWPNFTIYRPLTLSNKQYHRDYCNRNNLNFADDPTNYSADIPRSYLRTISPQLKAVHPGVLTNIRKHLLKTEGLTQKQL